jgi:hypothetical protein
MSHRATPAHPIWNRQQYEDAFRQQEIHTLDELIECHLTEVPGSPLLALSVA